MNDDIESLKGELRRFRAADTSDELRRRLEAELGGPPAVARSDHQSMIVRWGPVAAAASVLVAIIVALWSTQGADPANPPHEQAASDGSALPEERQSNPDVTIADPPAPPDLWTYRQAAASPEQLAALLDYHAGVLLPPSSNPGPRAWNER